MKASKFALLALIAAGAPGLAAPALANDCDAVIAASLKQMGMPYRTEMTITSPGAQPTKGQAIFMVSKLYTQVNGKWNVIPINAQQMSQQIQASMKTGSISCKKVGPDSVDGEAATIYTAHDVQQGNNVDTKTWISNSRNLPLRSQAQISSGSNTQTIDMTIGYNNVSAPAGVQ
jgi:hypothetical protein